MLHELPLYLKVQRSSSYGRKGQMEKADLNDEACLHIHGGSPHQISVIGRRCSADKRSCADLQVIHVFPNWEDLHIV